MIVRPLTALVVALIAWSCSPEPKTLFMLVPSGESGLDFVNTIEEHDSVNILTVQYMYHGGAVAVGDFNNDSLTDIFFSGNMVANRLYLNRGNLHFEDVSQQAGIGADDKWNSGVAVADVNADGWLDIYVCATIEEDSLTRANSLFINQGTDSRGIPSFKDQAKAFGVDDKGYSQNAAFLDYDLDGDLDLYVLTNLESDKIPSNYRPRIMDGSALNNDRLYRNNGNNSFTDVTLAAGILIEGYGLGIGVADINEDGWPDLYIGNDYVSNDVLYINNRDGTFTNQIKRRVKHQSLFSMGVDISDVNNDQHVDIITLDMLPENNLRRKTVSGAGATYFTYINNRQFGYEFQYMRNMLHANNGDGTFQEVGQMAGVHQTEWSWSSLFMDVDNDGNRDLMITNGFPKDVTDKDYVMFKRETGAFNNQRSLIDSIPILKVANYGFKNNGNFSFTDKSKEWGLSRPSFSSGAAFADLDNDGDLDYVVSNINDVAFLYENTLYGKESINPESNFLRIKLRGISTNSAGLGTKVTIRYDGKTQLQDVSIYRGYLSSVEDVVHFGLGKAQHVDTLTVVWQDGRVQEFYDVKSNQLLEVVQNQAKAAISVTSQTAGNGVKVFTEIASTLGLKYTHQEWDKVDFYRQRTLPHKFSQAGPGLAVGDIENDGLEDFIVGGSSLYDATIFRQAKDGTFTTSLLPKGRHNKSEDEGLLLFDSDGDQDLDLYVVSGSYEGEAGEERYQDRLYLNDGKGKFSLADNALPDTRASGSCVRACDFDNDGDLDLFVGGRVVAGAYPLPPDSYLLENDHGKFKDVTSTLSPELRHAGMITDALWSDFNGDGTMDLIVTGEFMAVKIFRNTAGKLVLEKNTGFENHKGWWNSLAAGDFDKDGDTDYVIGNIGENNYYNISDKTPLRVYAKDFDSNGSVDAILSCYFKSEEGDKKEFPAHFWDELYGQSPKFRNQFSSYKQYGSASMEGLLKPYDTTGMLVLTANYPHTAYAENKGGGVFNIKALPSCSQVAPVNGIVITDVNGDLNLDIIATGNDYGNEVFSGRYDAGIGTVLLGDGKGNFAPLTARRSGFKVDGDAKALGVLSSAAGGEVFIATQNLDSLKVFKRNATDGNISTFRPGPSDQWAMLDYGNGKRQRVEFYYGSGYLTQSTRSIEIPSAVTSITVFDNYGKQRVIQYQNLKAAR